MWEKYVTNDTKVMIRDLCKKHELVEKLKRRAIYYLSIFTGTIILLFWSAFTAYKNGGDPNPLSIIAILFGNSIHLIAFIAIAIMYSMYIATNIKLEKEKKKLKKLRSQVISHLNSPWFINHHAEIRDEISIYLKDNYDINVRYITD